MAVGTGLLLYDIYLLTYVLVGAGILLFAGAVFVIFYSCYWVGRNRLSPVMRVQARVVRRRKKHWEVGMVGGTPESSIARLGLLGRQRDEAWRAYSREMAKGDVPEVDLATGTNYFVTFDIKGQEKEFSTPEDYFIKCNEGIEGLLVYRGEEFTHFIPDVS